MPLRFLALCGVLLLLTSCAAAQEPRADLVVASWNLEWFYDADPGDNASDLAREMSAPTPEDWRKRVEAVAGAIARLSPDLLALQEIENARVLRDLATVLEERHGLKYRFAFIEGADPHTEQDVGLLYRGDLVRFSRREQTRAMFESEEYYNLSKHLFAEFEWGEGAARERLLVVNVHLRSGDDGAKVRTRQARLLKAWIADELAAGGNVIVLGDFNTGHRYPESPEGSELAVLEGTADDGSDELLDLHSLLPEHQRATHLSGGEFDRIFVSGGLADDDPARRDLVVRGMRRRADVCVRGRAQDRSHRDGFWAIPEAERDLSDHYPLVAEFIFR